MEDVIPFSAVYGTTPSSPPPSSGDVVPFSDYFSWRQKESEQQALEDIGSDPPPENVKKVAGPKPEPVSPIEAIDEAVPTGDYWQRLAAKRGGPPVEPQPDQGEGGNKIERGLDYAGSLAGRAAGAAWNPVASKIKNPGQMIPDWFYGDEPPYKPGSMAEIASEATKPEPYSTGVDLSVPQAPAQNFAEKVADTVG